MIEKIMKAVKSSNKRRGRNITIGAVIGFLLSCTAVMGADEYLWIRKNDGEEIKFNTEKTTQADGSDGKNWSEENPYSDNKWDKDTEPKTYINNITLSSSEINGNYGISYGLRLSGELTDVNFVNNNSITGKVSSGDGYGIYNSAEMGNIKNAGEISGSGISGGCGIENKSGTIGGITNTGEISGSGIGNSNATGNGFGYGIDNSGTMGNIENKGVISGTGKGASIGKGYGYGIDNSATMKNITNTGIISGTGIGDSRYSGEGYGIKNILGTMENITNTGLISGTGIGTSSSGDGEGYGINNYSTSTMGKITNTGVISGIGKDSSGNNKGYGISNGAGTIGDITNAGVISGIGTTTGTGIHNESYDKEMGKITNTGIISGTDYGIYNGSSSTMGAITNTGVIYGKDNAIKNDKDIQNNTGTITATNNYGILVTKGSSGVDGLTTSNNYGLIIKNEGENQGDITVGNEGTQDIAMEYDEDEKVIKSRSMTIKNETGSNSFDGNKENHILNALTNTYKVTGENNNVTGSIINAYGTAVVFGDTGDKELTLSGTIVNGGIDGSAAISGSDDTDNGDNLILQSGKIKYKDGSEVTQNTVVNGNIDMKDGNDTLTVGDGTIINGTLDGGDGADILNFGISSVAKSNPAESEGVKILHSITGFENMNINTNVTLFEKTIEDGKETDLKVTGVDKIKIGKDGNLILRIDGTNNNSHALSNNGILNGTIDSDGGKLLLALNGVSEGSEIDIKMNLGDGLYGVENTDIEYSDLFTLDTTSLLHSVSKNESDSTKVTVTSKSTLPSSSAAPEDVNYEKLNKIYQSMRVVDGVKEFDVDSDEKLSTFLGYLNDIYAGNPYSYSSELSRKSVGMFRDIATENQFKPELNKWLIMGGLTHVDGGTKDTYYGKGYYTYDIGSSDMDADTKITGAYMLGEYGVSDTLTYGVLIGGNKLKSDLSNGSKVDGDALYIGAYAKKYVGNLKVTGGLGLQYGDYDADRFSAGKGIAETRSYSDNYNDMTYDIYLNGRYSHNIGNNLFLEPYGTLSYTYVDQEGADEGSKVLAIETDSKSFDYTAAKVGVDIKKVIPHEKGKSTVSAGVSYTRLLTGADEENITGRFKGENATDFDILVAHKNEQSIGLNAKYALELENGILFDVKGSYSLERDSHNGTGKNRNKGEWIVGAGIGYKF